MSFTLSQLFILLACLAIAMYFFSELHVREIALKAARQHSDALSVQLLDQSVGIHRVWLKRGRDNRLHIWRNYQFEFTSTGDERYKGHVITLGEQVETVQLQVHKVPLRDSSHRSNEHSSHNPTHNTSHRPSNHNTSNDDAPTNTDYKP